MSPWLLLARPKDFGPGKIVFYGLRDQKWLRFEFSGVGDHQPVKSGSRHDANFVIHILQTLANVGLKYHFINWKTDIKMVDNIWHFFFQHIKNKQMMPNGGLISGHWKKNK